MLFNLAYSLFAITSRTSFYSYAIQYQVQRGNELTAAAGLSKTARSVQADFMELKPFADNSFDG